MGPSNGHRLVLLAAVALAGAAVDSVTALSSGPHYFDLINLKLSFAIVMVALVAAFFLLGFFSICLPRCAGPPLGGPDDAAGIGRITRAAASRSRTRRTARGRGLDRAVLHSFPTMAYADVKAHRAAAAGSGKGGAALECAVCLCEFDDDDTLRLLLPRCAHAFHADCIDAWLASHVTCPVCRAVLLAPDAAPASPAAVPGATEEHDGHAAVPVPAAPPRQPAAAIETSTASPEQQQAVAVVVVVDAAAASETEEQRIIRREEAAELMRIGSVKRALRSKSGRRPAQFPRSHTTGHSLAGVAALSPSPSPSPSTLDDPERYTLRLPDHVLRQVVAAGNLRRSASVQTGGGGTTRRGFGIARAGRSVRLGNSGGWPTMSVLARNFSARLPAWGSVRRGEADASPKGAKFAGDDGKAVEQCDGGACPLGAHV